jgi:hypothetical protein
VEDTILAASATITDRVAIVVVSMPIGGLLGVILSYNNFLYRIMA